MQESDLNLVILKYILTPMGLKQQENYSLDIFENPDGFREAAFSLEREGAALLKERVRLSCVPPFLGYLINGVMKEVASEFDLKRGAAVSVGPAGVVIAGGSNLLETVNTETAYRVFRHEFPEWTATYGLAYACTMSFAGMNRTALLRYQEAKMQLNRCRFLETKALAAGVVALLENSIGMKGERQRMQKLESVISESEMAFRLHGGITYLMEQLSERPRKLRSFPAYCVRRFFDGYPSASDLSDTRDFVENFFGERKNLTAAFLEAQRLNVLDSGVED